jgi:hypothetical protein
MKVIVEFTNPVKFSWVNWLVRKVEGTDYGHVRLRVVMEDHSYVYEANDTNVRLLGQMKMKMNPVEVLHSYTLSLSEEQEKEFPVLLEFAGLEYGYKQLIGILLQRKWKLKWNPLNRGREHQICSEFVAIFLMNVMGYYIDKDIDILSPKDIKRFLDEVVGEDA